MAERPAHKYLRWVFTLLLTAAAIAAVVFVLPWLLRVLWPIVVAWCLALITAPVVRFLQDKLHAKHKLSSSLVLILILAVVFGLLYGIVRLLVSEAMTLIPNIPNYVTAASEVVDKIEAWLAGARVNLPQGLFTLIDSLEEKAGEWFISISANVGIWLTNTLANMAVHFPRYLIYFIMTVLLTFYFIDGRDQIKERIKTFLPRSVVDFWTGGKSRFRKQVGNYLMTQFKLCWIVGGAMCICFLLKGIKYTGLLTIAITILDFLPIVGAGTILNPWGIIELLRGDIWMALYCFGLYIITQVIRNSLSPKMMGDSLSIPPLTSVLCMFLGFRFWGIGGMIIAIPLWLVVVEIYKAGVFSPALGVIKEIWAEIDGLLRKPGEESLPYTEPAGELPETEGPGKEDGTDKGSEDVPEEETEETESPAAAPVEEAEAPEEAPEEEAEEKAGEEQEG